MTGVLDAFAPTDVVVQTLLGVTATGKTYAPAATLSMFVEDGRKLVRAPTGEQIISETTLYGLPALVSAFTVDSKITVNGRAALVITAKLRVVGDPDVDHVEVALT